MKKIISLLSLAFIISTTLNAQEIKFEQTTIDYGTILETEGNVTKEFIFTNTGTKPLVINSVRASCGCTTPGWTKEPIKPGETGFIKATYGAKGRISPFNKTLTVISNASNTNRVVLTIKGVVIAAPVDIKKEYPAEIGTLRLKEIKDLSFPEINTVSKSPSQILEVGNPSETDILKIELLNVPNYVIAKAEPENLQPQQKGVIRFFIYGNARKTHGYKSDPIKIKVGNASKTINIASIVRQNIAAAEKDSKGILGSSVVDGGTASKGKSLSATVEVKNEGFADLVLSGITSDNDIFTFAGKKLPVIKAGETAKLKFAAKKTQEGINKTEVYFETNSPYNNSLLHCTIVGTIE